MFELVLEFEAELMNGDRSNTMGELRGNEASGYCGIETSREATMWFYIFYRVKEDGPVMFGQKLPFEHH